MHSSILSLALLTITASIPTTLSAPFPLLEARQRVAQLTFTGADYRESYYVDVPDGTSVVISTCPHPFAIAASATLSLPKISFFLHIRLAARPALPDRLGCAQTKPRRDIYSSLPLFHTLPHRSPSCWGFLFRRNLVDSFADGFGCISEPAQRLQNLPRGRRAVYGVRGGGKPDYAHGDDDGGCGAAAEAE
ncbi:MAG: hypothetical protein Q9211_006416, partial [Gyalolechia sp. 1 TL-2023]